MTSLRLGAVLAAAMAAMVGSAAHAAETIHTDTITLSTIIPPDGGLNVASSTITGAFGTEIFSTGKTILFSTIMVTSNDQGTVETYDFSYNCVAGTPGCTTNPTVFSKYPGGGAFHVSYTLDTGEIPGAPFPTLGHPTSASADIDFGVTDFVFVSSGKVHAVETFSVTSAAPEPASWALMLLGFGGLGVALRARRTAAA